MADYYTKPPPSHSQNGNVSKTFASNHPCCYMVGAAFKHVPQPAVTTFALSSVFIRLQCPCSHSCIIFNFCLKKTKENTLTMMNCSINFQMFLKSLIRLFCIYILQPRNLMFFTLSPFQHPTQKSFYDVKPVQVQGGTQQDEIGTRSLGGSIKRHTCRLSKTNQFFPW